MFRHAFKALRAHPTRSLLMLASLAVAVAAVFLITAIARKKYRPVNEAAKELQEGEMPPMVYAIMHHEARLSTEEKKLIDGLKRTFGSKKKKD